VLRLSSSASQGVKSLASCFQASRRGTRSSLLRGFFIFRPSRLLLWRHWRRCRSWLAWSWVDIGLFVFLGATSKWTWSVWRLIRIAHPFFPSSFAITSIHSTLLASINIPSTPLTSRGPDASSHAGYRIKKWPSLGSDGQTSGQP
jgi:hypothetical protein